MFSDNLKKFSGYIFYRELRDTTSNIINYITTILVKKKQKKKLFLQCL